MNTMFKDKTLLTILGLVGIGFLLYMIKGIIMPFIIALIFAYLLDPLVRFLGKYKISRSVATVAVVLMFFIIVGFVSMMIMPLMYNQITKLIDFLLQYKNSVNHQLLPAVANKLEGLPPDMVEKFEQSLSNISSYIVTFIANILKEIFHSSMVAVNILSLVFITPIVTFYILRDWENIPSTLRALIPPRFTTTTDQLLHDVDTTLAGYLRGQIYVCLILGVYYAAALSIVGLESGVSLGFLTGIFSFVPYVGALFGTILAVLITALQFQSLTYMATVAAIFIIGQILEGNFFTPKLIGGKVGLHPVWIMFGLLALGALFGFIGILIAVPLTAVIGVFIRFTITKYKQSRFYNSI